VPTVFFLKYTFGSINDKITDISNLIESLIELRGPGATGAIPPSIPQILILY
jgi:hypothetical protein